MMKDLSITQLAINAGLDLDLTYGEPALVYINEAFYGLMNLRTESNANGIAGLYDVKKNKITLAKITTVVRFIKKDGDFDHIDAFVKAIKEKDIEYVKNEMDLNSFIDYMVFESYIGNSDWPHNNAKFYAIDGGKFRFILFDLDKAVWLKINKPPLKFIEDKNHSNILSDLFLLLYEEESFKEKFWTRYNFLLENGVISFDKFKPIVENNSNQIKAEMPLQIDKYKTPNSMTDWKIETVKLLDLFKVRENVVREFVE